MSRIGLQAIAAMLLLAIFGPLLAASLYYYAPLWQPSKTDYPVQGIDVSHHQGDIDWPAVRKAGVAFAYIKATEGGDWRDGRFAEHWRAAQAVGIRRGAYHFYRLCRPAADQVANFAAVVPRDAEALPPVLDLEDGGHCGTPPDPEKVRAEIRILIEGVERHSGKPATLYLTREFEEAYGISRAMKRKLWLRSLFFEPRFGARPWHIWQASNMRRIEGIRGPVDWNAMRT